MSGGLLVRLINKFLKDYASKTAFYENTARLCAEVCESELEREGIRAIVTYRAKRVDRLREKVIKRNRRKNYSNIKQIYDDIVDLSGVRIAIYFPNDIDKIDKFIKSQFEVHRVKNFPQHLEDKTFSHTDKRNRYEKIFSGYHATHYRVSLTSDQLKQYGITDISYTQAAIEIQVASVLMLAWAEVEHDLVYKPLNGQLSIAEYEILDELNGLVLAGELALRRLQKAVKERISKDDTPFSNHYELAAFIYDRISDMSNAKCDEITMGRVDVLYNFLRDVSRNTPEYINQYIEFVDYMHYELSIVEQIIDMIIEREPYLYRTFLEVKNNMVDKNPYINSDEEDNIIKDTKKYMLYFIDKLADLQIVMDSFIEKFYPGKEGSLKNNMNIIIHALEDDEITHGLNTIKDINFRIIHDNSLPHKDILVEGGMMIESIINQLLKKFDTVERRAIQKRIDEIQIDISS